MTTEEHKEFEERQARRNSAVQKLESVQSRLMTRNRFFGLLSVGMQFIEDSDTTDSFGCVNDKFYYSIDYVEKSTIPELLYVLAHSAARQIVDELNDGTGDFTERRERVYNHLIAQMLEPSVPHKTLDVEYDPSVVDAEMSYADAIVAVKADDVKKGYDEDTPPLLRDTQYNRRPPPRDGGEGDRLRRIINAASAAGNDGLPPAVRAMIEQFGQTKVDYKSILRQHIASMKADEKCFTRHNRRNTTEFIFPGKKKGKKIRVIAAVDNSGSMSESMIRDLLTEIYGMMMLFDDYEVIVLSYDTAVYNPQTFTPANAYEMAEYKAEGGGGTNFACIYEYIEKNDIDVDQLINFTDGYDFGDGGKEWSEKLNIDTIFVVHSHHGTYDPGFGTVIEYTGPTGD